MHPNYQQHVARSYNMDTLIRRRQDPEYVTELVHEVGTTREAIGDATMEIMITTPGEIPDHFYDLDTRHEDATIQKHHEETVTVTTKKSVEDVSGFAAHSTLCGILLIALLLLVLICCLSACVIARARRRQASSSELECDPECRSDVKQPLISSDTTCKSSDGSTRQ